MWISVLLPNDATFVQFPRNASKCAAAHAAYISLYQNNQFTQY